MNRRSWPTRPFDRSCGCQGGVPGPAAGRVGVPLPRGALGAVFPLPLVPYVDAAGGGSQPPPATGRSPALANGSAGPSGAGPRECGQTCAVFDWNWPMAIAGAPLEEKMDRVNLFNPFGRRPESEDRPTWAFLATLKYDPLLQNFLRDLVQSRLPFELPGDRNPWEPTRVSTQTKWILPSSTLLVSVLLTDEAMHE